MASELPSETGRRAHPPSYRPRDQVRTRRTLGVDGFVSCSNLSRQDLIFATAAALIEIEEVNCDKPTALSVFSSPAKVLCARVVF